MAELEKKNISVVCFGGEDWWYHNRGHFDMQLMRRYARMGTTLYINSIVMQKLNFKKNTGGGASLSHKLIRKLKSILSGLKKTDAGFWVYSPLTLPIHHISCARWLNKIILSRQIYRVAHKLGIDNPIVWVACPAACEIAIKMKKSFLVYQRTDRFEEYPNVDGNIIKTYDQKLKNSADITIFVNQILYDEEIDQCRKALYLDHGVDYEIFSSAGQYPDKPDDMPDIPKPIVGFFGGIDEHTSDIALIEEVVDLLPEMSFVFVGKVSAEVSGLRGKKNVWLLGQKPYEQIPHYGKYFDVAIMPWKQNRWIRACNPIKLKEYLALGKPIVSTPFAELAKYHDVVYEAKTSEEFAESIKRAIEEDNEDQIAIRKQKVEKASWDSKAAILVQELMGVKTIGKDYEGYKKTRQA